MRGASAIVGIVLACAGCAARAAEPDTIARGVVARTSMCDASPTLAPAAAKDTNVDAFDGQPIAAIEVTGVDGELAAMVRGAIDEQLFAPLDPQRLAADVRRVYALGAIAQVELRVRADVAG